jgi:hypothetical protein
LYHKPISSAFRVRFRELTRTQRTCRRKGYLKGWVEFYCIVATVNSAVLVLVLVVVVVVVVLAV